MTPTQGDRDAVLGRIREALRVPAPLKHPAERSAGGEPTTAHFREWLPPVGPSLDARFELFSRLSETLKSELIVCADMDEAAAQLIKIATEASWKTLGLHHGELTSALASRLPADLGRIFVDDGYDKNALEASDAGLTECELLVAQTGSVCVTGPSSGGRVLSVLPPHHVVIARRSQIVTDLSEAYASLAAKYRDNYPSMISFITGPSRTGDIERILVLGAHGPKRLTILLLP
ncbi:MAG: LUD domain-containing protein [Verrucomicrobiota bacterium]